MHSIHYQDSRIVITTQAASIFDIISCLTCMMRRHKIFALMLLLLEWQQQQRERRRRRRRRWGWKKGSISWLFQLLRYLLHGLKTTLQSRICLSNEEKRRRERQTSPEREGWTEEKCKFFIWTPNTHSSRPRLFPFFPISIIENKFHSSGWSCLHACFVAKSNNSQARDGDPVMFDTRRAENICHKINFHTWNFRIFSRSHFFEEAPFELIEGGKQGREG